MYSTVHSIVAALRAPSSISRSVWRCGFFLSQFAFALASLVLSGSVEAAALSRFNTADGDLALNVAQYSANGTGSYNTGLGYAALLGDYTGNYNTASGANALYRNDSGSYNTANGFNALYTNSSASYNTAQGYDALFSNTTGTFNTADGVNALLSNQGGNNNSAVGFNALASNISGSNNIGIGYQAGYNLSTGNNNIIIGAGLLGKAGEANTTRIGRTTQTAAYIGGIYNKTAASGSAAAVFIDSTGKLGTVKSSARYKHNIKPMDKASEALLALEPVTFRFKQELDPDGVTQFGLIAEQVEEVCPDLVVRDEDGKVSTVRYEAVNAMLLNEFLKEHRRVQDLEKQIASLTAGLQKVTAELETRQPASGVAISQK